MVDTSVVDTGGMQDIECCSTQRNYVFVKPTYGLPYQVMIIRCRRERQDINVVVLQANQYTPTQMPLADIGLDNRRWVVIMRGRVVITHYTNYVQLSRW